MSRSSFLVRGLSVVCLLAVTKTNNTKRDAKRLGKITSGGIIDAYEDYDTYYPEEDENEDWYLEDLNNTFWDWYLMDEKERQEQDHLEACMFDDYWDYPYDDYDYSVEEYDNHEVILSDEDRHF